MCGAFVKPKRTCTHDGACYRRNADHFVQFAHPREQQKPTCPRLLLCESCFDQSADHTKTFYHGPCARVLDRVAQGLSPYPSPPTARPPKRAKKVTTTTTTTTTITPMVTTTTTTTTAASPLAPPMPGTGGGALRADFVCPPFSILDAKQGPWQARKREWNALGLDSGAGRPDDLLKMGNLQPSMSGTSIFDPVLAECALRWFAPKPTKGGPPVIVLDPCAGGSVRGVVSAMLGFLYIGIDCSEVQCRANEKQTKDICLGVVEHMPIYVVGDGVDVKHHFAEVLKANGLPADTLASMILTCPPYHSLEKYGGPEKVDLSMLSYDDFKERYKQLLANATSLLKPSHVAVTVIGNTRDSNGAMRDLHGLTKASLEDTGNVLYADAILETCLASAPMRAGRQMKAAAKLVSTHQNVVVTCRGAPLTTALCHQYGIRPAG